ncbi:MAG TPA: hypothetical protein VKA60_26225 [Blastocatellia bacterium]|nr:hypothetical protein [Blastocatellia bacterium]
MSINRWEELSRSKLVLRITQRDIERRTLEATASPSPRANWIFPVGLPLILSTVTALLLVLSIFRLAKDSPDALRLLHRVVIAAAIIGAVATVLGIGGVFELNDPHRDRRRQWRPLPLLTAIVTSAIFVAALVSWLRNNYVPEVTPLNLEAIDHQLMPAQKRIFAATTVVNSIAADNSQRIFTRAGVVIGISGNQAWILTVPEPAPAGEGLASDNTWVTFHNGRTCKGSSYLITLPSQTLELIITEDDAVPSGDVVNPAADSAVPGGDFQIALNPASSGWQIARGTVLDRRRLYTSAGPLSLLKTHLDGPSSVIGCGLYDADGNLVAMVLGVDEAGDETQAISLPSGLIAKLRSLGTPGAGGPTESLRIEEVKP